MMQMVISFEDSYFPENLPKAMALGKATNWVTSNASSSPVESRPSAEP